MAINQQLLNVVLLGIGFQLILSAFSPTMSLQILVLQDIRNESNWTFNANGYTSLALLHGSLATSNWIAPAIISFIGPQIAMAISAIYYAIYCASFVNPTTLSVYLMSVGLGVAGAFLWTGQAVYLSKNSSQNTATRNSGIFMTLVSVSQIFGFVLSFIFLQGQTSISADTRTLLFLVFAGICAPGAAVLLLLPTSSGRLIFCSTCTARKSSGDLRVDSSQEPEDPNSGGDSPSAALQSPVRSDSPRPSESSEGGSEGGTEDKTCNRHWRVFVKTCRLAITPEMLPIYMMATFSGMASTMSNVYVTCVGNSRAFGSFATSAAPLAGLCMTVGMIAGNLLIAVLGRSRRLRARHEVVVLLGFAQIAACLLLLLFFTPPKAPFEPADRGWLGVEPRLAVSFCASVLLGWGAMCYDTEVLAFVCRFFKEDAGPAYSLFKSAQAISIAVSFAYSRHLLFPWQLLILGITATTAAIAFWLLQCGLAARRREANEAESLA